MPRKPKKIREALKLEAKIVHGICPYCSLQSPLIFLYKDFYRCALCGEEVEQYINGVIKYIPITINKRISLMTDINK